MLKQYDKETGIRFEIEMCRAEDVAENGEHANIERIFPRELPSAETIEGYMRHKGHDTVSITKIIEETVRYSID